jgi:flagellar biosynthesis/type III secretory pathway protein FliH
MIAERYLAKRFRQGKREGMAQGKREGMAQGKRQGKRKEVERKLRYNPNPSPERRDG